MSDYMYLLDSHLSIEQSQLLNEIQAAVSEAGAALYLTGGAMRDMLGGFPIRDLDLTFEQLSPAKIAKAVAAKLPGLECEEDPASKNVELRMPSGATASLRMAHVQKVAKPGAAPKVSPAHLLEDLAQRDFTVNAIALSLAKASRGLIRDPCNGVSDLQTRQIRTAYPHSFFDEPVRLLRAVRLRRRLGFELDERTQRYFNTGLEEGWVKCVSAAAWSRELRLIASEAEPSGILGELEASHLLPVEGLNLNLPGLERWEKLRRMIPGRGAEWHLFLQVVTEAMKQKERAAFLAAFGLDPEEWETAQKAKPRVAKLEASLKSPGLRRPSQVYNAIAESPSADILALLYESETKLVQDRLRSYLETYLPVANEITDAQVEATGAKPGSAQFRKAKTALIAARLNAPPPEPVPEGTPVPNGPQGPGSQRAVTR